MVVFMYFNKGACALNAMANNSKGWLLCVDNHFSHPRICLKVRVKWPYPAFNGCVGSQYFFSFLTIVFVWHAYVNIHVDIFKGGWLRLSTTSASVHRFTVTILIQNSHWVPGFANKYVVEVWLRLGGEWDSMRSGMEMALIL